MTTIMSTEQPTDTDQLLREFTSVLEDEAWYRAGHGSKALRADTRRRRERVEAKVAAWGAAYDLNAAFDSGYRIGHRAGTRDALVAAFAALQRDAEEGEGPAVATVYEVAQELGVDGAGIVERVAAVTR